MTHRFARRGMLALGFGFAASGCAAPPRGTAVPRARTREATVLGLPNERFFPSFGTAAMEAEYLAAMDRRRVALGLRPGAVLPKLDLLAISGGGEDGAFGAGLLCGWSEQGTRPVFELVTGISTGALTAPFAFLGRDYDQQLRQIYTEISPADVLRQRFLLTAVFDDALADNAPLFNTISRLLDPAMLAAIARGYQEGRLLMVASTDLDAQVPVVWNVGAIAASGHPRALDVVRRLLLASAAIPGAFPPVLFDVTLDGQPHQEMHVDGGAIAQVFLYPNAVTVARRALIARRQPVQPVQAFVIRNARLDPDWAEVNRRTMSIAGRAISTMIASAGYNDVLRIYNTTQRDQVEFRLAFIGRDFTGTLNEPFEQAYMRALFDNGFARARGGFDWARQPPLSGADRPAAG
jgi:predicted acylesterase/phospholipase RssA